MLNRILEQILPLFLLIPSFSLMLSYKKASNVDKVPEKMGVQFKDAKKSLAVFKMVNKITYYIYIPIFFLQLITFFISKVSVNISNRAVLHVIIVSYLVSVILSYIVSYVVSKKYE